MEKVLISNKTYFEEKIGFSRAVRVGPFISVGGTAPIGTDEDRRGGRSCRTGAALL